MRGVSFATLHRSLCSVVRVGTPVQPKEINDFVRDDLERVSGMSPGATTLYRYRSTLHRLGLMSKQGRAWSVELNDPLVRTLTTLHPSEGQSLVARARIPFAEIVLRHPDCRSLLFDIFVPEASGTLDFDAFCTRSAPVGWRKMQRGNHPRLEVWNRHTKHRRHYEEKQAILSVLYGLRYWVRDELGVVDEYAELGENAATLFAVQPLPKEGSAWEAQVLDAVRFVLGQRRGTGWTAFEVADLIRRYCVAHRQARRVLFAALEWLRRYRGSEVSLVPTPVAVATLSASSASREHLELRRYYRDPRGRLIGDVRIHSDAEVP